LNVELGDRFCKQWALKGLKYKYFMSIFDESLVTLWFLLLNTLVVNKFILFHELSRRWKKQLRNILG
jgi:hypothetical protein